MKSIKIFATVCVLFLSVAVLTGCSTPRITNNSLPPTPFERIGDITELSTVVENGKTTLGEALQHLQAGNKKSEYSDYELNSKIYTTHLKSTNQRLLVVHYWIKYPGLRYSPNALGKTTKNIIISLRDDNLDKDNIIENVSYSGASYQIFRELSGWATIYYHSFSEKELKDFINYDFGQVRFHAVKSNDKKSHFTSDMEKDENERVESQIRPILGECQSLERVENLNIPFGPNDDNSIPKLEHDTDHFDYVDWGDKEISVTSAILQTIGLGAMWPK